MGQSKSKKKPDAKNMQTGKNKKSTVQTVKTIE